MAEHHEISSIQRVRLATRASPLALWQANHVKRQLLHVAPTLEVEMVHAVSHGDRITDVPLASLGGQGAFTRAIQAAVLDGRADVAVHSLKDLPTLEHPELTLIAVAERGSPWDALVARDCSTVAELSPHARVATGSPRRRAQLLRLRPDLEIVDVRGNVDTRLRRLDEGAFEAMVLARAGLERLGFGDRIRCSLEPPDFIPAPGQGAIGIECRASDRALCTVMAQLDHRPTRWATDAERATLAALAAGCHLPVGAYAAVHGASLDLFARVLAPNGEACIEASASGAVESAAQLGRELADLLHARGAGQLLR